jgi:hypothetical protein
MKDTKYLWTQIGRICLFLTVFFFIQTVISFFYIRQISHTQVQNELVRLNTIVKNDLVYNNDRWDISLYTSDSRTPHPQGSSGFPHPLYVITTSGFVIERNKPISGLLDSSDFDKVQDYAQATTIITVTNENWRIQARPIQSNGKLIGDIVVAYYNEQNRPVTEIDPKLQQNLDILNQKIRVENEKINVKNVDIRNVHYDVTFEIVDSYNKVLLNNGRVPTFIDRSYVAEQFEAQPVRIVKDANTKDEYLVVTDEIVDKNGSPVALIVSGRSIQEIRKTLNAYIIFAAISGLLILLPLAWLMLEFILHVAKDLIAVHELKKQKAPILNKIQFNKKESFLKLNEQVIQIPYASNQFYILSALFTNPKKRWEQDEILEKFGATESGEEGWRKVYDAHLAINRKVGFKLIDYRDKLFRINPNFIAAIVSS